MYLPRAHSFPYALILVDLYSQYVLIEPLKRKTAESVKAALEKLITENNLMKITTISSDSGTEFTANISYFKQKGIKWFLLKSEVKANLAELSIRIFKSYLYKLIRLNPGTVWTKLYDKVVDQMNMRSIKSLDNKSPKDLFSPFADVYERNNKNDDSKTAPIQQSSRSSQPRPKGKLFKINDLVFLDIKKNVNDKGHDIQRGAIKRVTRIDKQTTPYLYTLSHLNSEKVLPRSYYGAELRLAPKLRAIPKQIDKIYDSRRKNKRREFQVSFYGSDFKSWIPERILYKF